MTEIASALSEMVKRLRRVKSPGYVRHTAANTFTSNAVYVNPDGPAAAAELERLTADIARMRTAGNALAETLKMSKAGLTQALTKRELSFLMEDLSAWNRAALQESGQ